MLSSVLLYDRQHTRRRGFSELSHFSYDCIANFAEVFVNETLRRTIPSETKRFKKILKNMQLHQTIYRLSCFRCFSLLNRFPVTAAYPFFQLPSDSVEKFSISHIGNQIMRHQEVIWCPFHKITPAKDFDRRFIVSEDRCLPIRCLLLVGKRDQKPHLSEITRILYRAIHF